eukprot:5189543-Pyramimonas_sp.AAC.1
MWPASDIRPPSPVVLRGHSSSMRCEPADAKVLEVDVVTANRPHVVPCLSSKWRRMNPAQARGAPGRGI